MTDEETLDLIKKSQSELDNVLISYIRRGVLKREAVNRVKLSMDKLLEEEKARVRSP
jgi:hypothetical protein